MVALVIGLTTQSAGIIALGLSMVGIGIATTALWLVLKIMRDQAGQAGQQAATLDDLDARASRIEATNGGT